MAGSYKPTLTALREIRLGDRIYAPGESIEGVDISFEDMRRFVWENPFIGLGMTWTEDGAAKPAAKRRVRKKS